MEYPKEHSIVPYESKRPLHQVLIGLILLIDIVVFVVLLWMLFKNFSSWWCFLPWLLFFLLLPLLFWKRRVKEVTVDKATLEKLYNDNNLGKFRKYHILESEFAKLDFKKYLEKCCLRAYEEEAICPGEKEKDQKRARKHCEIVAERLNNEREKRANEIIRQFKTDPVETRTSLLADQIHIPQYDDHQ